MNRFPSPELRRQAGAIALITAAAGLLLTGCGGSPGSTGAGSSGAAGSSAGPGSSSAPASSGSSSAASSSGTHGTSVTSATVPFPVGVGDTWVYKTTYGRTVDRQTAVTPVSGGQQVTMTSTSTIEGSPQVSTSDYVVHSDGSISLPFSQFDTSSSGATVKLISGSIFWPAAAQLDSGRAYHDTLRIKFTNDGTTQRVTAHVTVRGMGIQSVTVPAGTYSATVVSMTMSEKIEGFTVGTDVKTWLATGVGPVKSEVIVDEAGTDHLTAEDELVSFHAG